MCSFYLCVVLFRLNIIYDFPIGRVAVRSVSSQVRGAVRQVKFVAYQVKLVARMWQCRVATTNIMTMPMLLSLG